MIEISRSHIEAALCYIALSCGGTNFTDWVMIVHVNTRYLPHHLIYDLKRDNTLPETFDSLDDFRSYLISQGACTEAKRLAAPVWKKYRRWSRKAVRS